MVKGALQDWDCNNLDINPGGIFADVNLIESCQIAIERVKATPTSIVCYTVFVRRV